MPNFRTAVRPELFMNPKGLIGIENVVGRLAKRPAAKRPKGVFTRTAPPCSSGIVRVEMATVPAAAMNVFPMAPVYATR